MAKDNPPLRLVGQRAASRRLRSRKEIEEWAAERRRVLEALVEAEKAGRGQSADRVQLQLEEVA